MEEEGGWMRAGRGSGRGSPEPYVALLCRGRDEWRAADADLCLESIAGGEDARPAADIRRHLPPPS